MTSLSGSLWHIVMHCMQYLRHLVIHTAKRGWNVVICNHRGLGGVSVTVSSSLHTYSIARIKSARTSISLLNRNYKVIFPILSIIQICTIKVLFPYPQSFILGKLGPFFPMLFDCFILSDAIDISIFYKLMYKEKLLGLVVVYSWIMVLAFVVCKCIIMQIKY